MAAPLIELRNVTKEYDEGGRRRTVLRGASLTIERGEMAVLVGRSGTGKSTLLNLLSGIDPPSSGEVVIDGVDLSALSERERTLFRRDRIGFVFQFFNLIPTLTVEENLLLPMELKGRIGPEQRRAALALLAEVGLADRTSSFPDRLSGGEQQRVAVARPGPRSVAGAGGRAHRQSRSRDGAPGARSPRPPHPPGGEDPGDGHP